MIEVSLTNGGWLLDTREHELRRQFRQYLLIAGPPNLIGVVCLIAIYASYGNYLLLVYALGCLINAVLYWAAYVRVKNHTVANTAPIICLGMWLLVSMATFTEERALPVTVLMVAMPVIALMPYVPMQTLLRQSLLAAGLMIASCLYIGFGYSMNHSDVVPDAAFSLLVNWGTAACVAIGALSLWHNARALNRAAMQMQTANQSLAISGRALEERVLERKQELKQTRAQMLSTRDTALASSRHKSVFLANMSHELRTPLNAILGFSEALQAEMFGALEAKQKEYIDDIHDAGHHLLNLINNILDHAKIEAGHYELNPKPTHVTDLISQCVDAMKQHGRAALMHFQIHIAEDVGEVELDPVALRKVLSNLLDNAVKFSEPGAAIQIRAQRLDHRLQIQVQDAGVGLEPEQAKQIFEPFSRGQTQYEQRAGVGLGLTLCRSLVELSGGSIWAEPGADVGALFIIELPLRVSE